MDDSQEVSQQRVRFTFLLKYQKLMFVFGRGKKSELRVDDLKVQGAMGSYPRRALQRACEEKAAH